MAASPTPGQLRAARSMLGLKQGELAAKAGVKRSVLQLLEDTNRALPSIKALDALRAVLEAEELELIDSVGIYGDGIRWRTPTGKDWVEFLRHARVMLGLTLDDLSKKSEVSKYTILRIESGSMKRVPELSAMNVRKTLASCGAVILPETRDTGAGVRRSSAEKLPGADEL